MEKPDGHAFQAGGLRILSPGVYTRSLALFTPHQVWPDPLWLLPPLYSCGGFPPSPAAPVLREGLQHCIWEAGRMA
jgi:hypothetical protein